MMSMINSQQSRAIVYLSAQNKIFLVFEYTKMNFFISRWSEIKNFHNQKRSLTQQKKNTRKTCTFRGTRRKNSDIEYGFVAFFYNRYDFSEVVSSYLPFSNAFYLHIINLIGISCKNNNRYEYSDRMTNKTNIGREKKSLKKT